jgi:hypothetical protein
VMACAEPPDSVKRASHTELSLRLLLVARVSVEPPDEG